MGRVHYFGKLVLCAETVRRCRTDRVGRADSWTSSPSLVEAPRLAWIALSTFVQGSLPLMTVTGSTSMRADRTIERSYLRQWRMLIAQYEAVRTKKSTAFDSVG